MSKPRSTDKLQKRAKRVNESGPNIKTTRALLNAALARRGTPVRTIRAAHDQANKLSFQSCMAEKREGAKPR